MFDNFAAEKNELISIAHGNGGLLSQKLIKQTILPYFNNELLEPLPDSTYLAMPHSTIAVSTDSYVVSPLFFPGGDIGSIAVYGTANDLAMSGAKPLYLSCAFIIEEGFAISTLEKILSSMKQALEVSGMSVITGDTKVVEHGKADGIYINTTGIGVVQQNLSWGAKKIAAQDHILISGDLGCHGASIMSLRSGLKVDPQIKSDCAPLYPLIKELIDANIEVHCARDLTRGGLTVALIELVEDCGLQFELIESSIAISNEVQSFCELLGLDPLTLACEGRCVLFVAEKDVDKAEAILKKFNCSASRIGKVNFTTDARVVLRNPYGAHKTLRMPVLSNLPRIC